MARYLMTGACPIRVDGKFIYPGDGEFDAELPQELHAFFTQIGAVSVVKPDPKPDVVATAKRGFRPLNLGGKEGD